MKTTKTTLLLFIAATLIISLDLHSQPWFGQVNHNYNNSTFSNGKRVFSLSLGADPWGYVRSGYWPSGPATAPNFEFSYLDGAGGYTSGGAFYAQYSIFDDPAACSTPVKKTNCNGVMVVNAVNTGGAEVFALAGVYDQGVFFSTISVSGNPVRTYRWNWPSTPNKRPRKPFIYTGNKAGTFYITGDFNTISYVMKVDATTSPVTVKWANFYYSGDTLASRAVIQSPFDTSQVIVVGSRYGSQPIGGKTHEGFVMTLNNTTGNVAAFRTYSDGSSKSNGWFTSIKPAYSAYGGSKGFIIGGDYYSGTLQNKTYKQWMTKISPTGASIWSSIIEPIYATSLGQETTWEINDVQERLNPNTNRYEYYGSAGSTITNGAGFTYDYLSVFKLDEDGTRGGLNPTEFRYFKTGGFGVFASNYLDYSELPGAAAAANNGLQMFSQDFTSTDHVFDKAYFNGVSGCTDSTTDIINIFPGPGYNQSPVTDRNLFKANCPNLFSLGVNFPIDNMNNVCYNPFVPGGSNMRMMATGLANEKGLTESDLSIYPNPSNGILFIRSGNEGKLKNAVIKIQNNLGQTFATFNPEQLGNSSDAALSIDLGKLNLAAGIYFVNVTSAQGSTVNYKIVYDK